MCNKDAGMCISDRPVNLELVGQVGVLGIKYTGDYLHQGSKSE